MSSQTVLFDDVYNKLDVTTYGNIEKITDTLSKCRVRIFYKGLNRNRTFISDDFAEQLIDSLPYAPIKGIFNYAEVDFDDHGEDNSDGRIYGIIPENPNFAWERHLDQDGIEREYASADVLLFTGLYPESKLVPGSSQSMEIFRDTMDGEWRIWNDGKPYFHFKKGSLVGLQTLGKKVEPCFEGAAFFSLYQELQKYIQQEEDRIMEKTIFRLSDSDKAIAIENMLNPNFNEEGGWKYDYCVIDTYDDYALCRDIKNQKFVRVPYTKDDTNNSVSLGESQEVFIVDVTQSEYSALLALQAVGGTYEKSQELFTELKTKINNLEAEVAEYKKNNNAFQADKEQLEKSIKEKESVISEYDKKIIILTEQTTKLQEEKAELQKFQTETMNEKKDAIIEEFSMYLTDEQISTYKNNMDSYTVEDFKKEICTAAYEADPTIFSHKEQKLVYTGGASASSGRTEESGVIRILNKYKNGGNK